MLTKSFFRDVEIYDNYILNTDEIIQLLEKDYNRFFLSRKQKESFSDKDDLNGGDVFSVERHHNIYKIIFKTIDKNLIRFYPDEVIIYRYKYGSFLPRHQDPLFTDKMLTDLTFLQSGKNHLKIYTEQFPDGYFIDENPGRRIIVPGDLEHEITKIEKDEITRYTLVMTWYSDYFGNPWWKERK